MEIHCSSTAEQLFGLLTTDEERKIFWAELTEEQSGKVDKEGLVTTQSNLVNLQQQSGEYKLIAKVL